MSFILESAAEGVKKEKMRHMSVKPLANIKMDLQLISELAQLKSLKLCQNIVTPAINELLDLPMGHFKYEGIQTLDCHQMDILRTVCTQIMHSVRNDRPLIQAIEGPAGTGKTRFIINLIIHMLKVSSDGNGQPSINVLVCASNKAAVDQIACQLSQLTAHMSKNLLFTFI